MKITDLKCAIIGQNPVIRILTDEGIEVAIEVAKGACQQGTTQAS